MSYFVEYSQEDNQFVGRHSQYRSLSHLANTKEEAMEGIEQLVRDVEKEMRETQTLYDLTNEI